MSVTWIDPGLLPSPTAASSFSDSVSPAHVNDSANGALLNPRHQTGRRGQRQAEGSPTARPASEFALGVPNQKDLRNARAAAASPSSSFVAYC